MKLNQSASPTVLSTNDMTIINDIKNNLKHKKKRYLKKDLNSQLKLSRNNLSNRRKTEGNSPPRLRNAAQSRNTVDKISSAQVTSKFGKLPFVGTKSSHVYTIETTISARENPNYSQNRSVIDGFTKHIYRVRERKIIRKGESFEIPKSRSTQGVNKRKKLLNKNNIKIVNQSDEKRKKNSDDYLLQRRIEREIHPDKNFNKRHWWNIMMREDINEKDYYMVSLKAKEKSRKALMKEERILESFSEKERIEHNKEVDQMLIDSLKAKIKLINGLTPDKY